MKRSTLLALFFLASLPLKAQQLYYDVHTISLRIFGEEGSPVTYKSGEITLPDGARAVPPKPPEEETYIRYLSLPDQTFSLEAFPFNLLVRQGGKEMRLKLGYYSIDSVRFREGSYDLTLMAPILMGTFGLNGTKILGQDIACFEVPDLEIEPYRPTVVVDSIQPFLFDSIEGLDYKTRYATDLIMGRTIDRRDWVSGTTMMSLGILQMADPRQDGYFDTIYVSNDGRHYRTIPAGPEEMLRPLVRVVNFFFPTPENAWVILDTGKMNYLAYRTGDGGKSWSLDSRLTDLRIHTAVPRGDDSAWFLGVGESQGDSGKWRNFHYAGLYTGTRDAGFLRPVDLPVKVLTRITNMNPDLLPVGENGLVISIPSLTPNEGEPGYSFFLRPDGTTTEIPEKINAMYTGPDGTGWISVEESAPMPAWDPQEYYNSRRKSTLIRISPDGSEVRPIITSFTLDFPRISFADASTGAVIYDNGSILLTTDAGESWRFVAMDPPSTIPWVERRTPPDIHIINTHWVDTTTLRLIYNIGTFDVHINELPPLRMKN